MDATSFLHDLHVRGSFDRGLFESFRLEEAGDEALRAVAAFEAVAAEFPPAELERKEAVPPAAIERLAEYGLFGLTIPRDHGGWGLSLTQYLKVVERVAPIDVSLALVSLAHLSIGVQGVILFGTPEQKGRFLRAAASGRLIFAYALTEPATGSDAKNIRTSARPSDDGSHWVLDGQKTYITNANYAGAYTVFAQIEGHRPGHMGAFVVERGSEGLEVGRDMPKMGLKASSTASVRFDGVRVPRENLLGEPGDGFRIAMAVLNYGRLAVCSAGVGLMDRSLADMAKRAADRAQFGVPIRSFELVQEKLARARAHAFAAASMVELAARQLDRDAVANVAAETSHCKLYCTTRAWQVLYDALQVAGGSGYLATNPYEKRMRDWRVATIFEGTTEIHSIYGPLFLMRSIRDALPRGWWGRLRALLVGAFGRTEWPLSPADPVVRRAARVARCLGRLVRVLLRLGLVLFGKDIPSREYVLRRITHASVAQYALLAAIARIEGDRRAGKRSPRDLPVVAYLTDEAREARRAALLFWPSRRERLAVRIADEIE